MAHLDRTYDSYRTFLTADDDAAWSLEGVWSVDLDPLNFSGVTGSVILARSEEADGTPILNVSIAAEGLTPNETHAQHVHGLLDDDGNAVDSVAPTIQNDSDGDDLVEVLEGVSSYGDVILSLLNAGGSFPKADSNGRLSYINNFDISDMSNLVSPVTGTQYSLEDLIPLTFREVVLHGVEIPDGIGEGTGGEVNGEGGYIPILPAAAGEIEETSVDEALNLLDAQSANSGGMFQIQGDQDFVVGFPGDDRITGDARDNRLFGGNGDDSVFGFAGSDIVGGGGGNDVVGGGGGADNVYGAAGNDTVFGVDGADRVAGGTGDDNVFGGNGNDTLFGGNGDDIVAGGSGNDVAFGGRGRDAVDGGAGNDTLRSGPDTNADNAADAGASGALTIDDYDNGYAGGDGNDVIFGGIGDDIITGDDDSRVASSVGGDFNASADGADTIYAGAGNDEIHTGSWADSDDGFDNSQTGMIGDIAFGGDGDDIIRGAGGNDRLSGDRGDDNVGGGGGADTFVHSGGAGYGFDTIVDYDNDEGDVLFVNVDDAQRDDFDFRFTDSTGDGSDDALIAQYDGLDIFLLNGFEVGDTVTIETQNDTFVFQNTPILTIGTSSADDLVIG